MKGKLVLRNIVSVLETKDMTRLTKEAYKYLINNCGFIAHYSHEGFISTYQNDIPRFIKALYDCIVRQKQHGYFDSPNSFLIDFPYEDMTKLEIHKELLLYLSNRKEDILASRKALAQDQDLKRLRLAEVIEQYHLRNNIPFEKYGIIAGEFKGEVI